MQPSRSRRNMGINNKLVSKRAVLESSLIAVPVKFQTFHPRTPSSETVFNANVISWKGGRRIGI